MNAQPRLRALGLVLLAFWLGLTIAMTVVAIVNFKTLKPEALRQADEVFAQLGDVETRKVALRYTASELNRLLFRIYGYAQLAVGLAALLVLVLGKLRGLLLGVVGLAFGTTLVFSFWLVPAISEKGRQIDFVARDVASELVQDFDRIHKISEGTEMVKFVLLLIAITALVRAAGKSGDQG